MNKLLFMLSLFLSASFCLADTLPLSPKLETKIYQYLLKKKESADLAEQANALILKRSLQCVERLSCLTTKDENQCLEVPSYNRTKKFLDGSTGESVMDCEGLLSYYFGIEISEDGQPLFHSDVANQYRDFRVYSALSAPRFRSDNKALALDLNNPQFIYDSTPKPLISRLKTGFMINHPTQTPLNINETDYLHDSYTILIKSWFSKFSQEHLKNYENYLEIKLSHYNYEIHGKTLQGVKILDLDQNCENDLYKYITTTHWHSFKKNCSNYKVETAIKDIKNKFLAWVNNKIHEIQKFSLNKSFEISLRNPLFFQISKSNFDFNELKKAFQNMIEVSNKVRKKRSQKKYSDWQSLIQYNETELRFQNENNVFVSNSLDVSEDDLIQIKHHIKQEASKQSRNNFLVQAGLAVGALAVCLTPVLKKIGMISKLSKVKILRLTPTTMFRAGCSYTIGMPLNTYFILSGFNQNANNWSQALSAAEHSQLKLDAKRLSAGNSTIYLGLLMVPVIYKFDKRVFTIFTDSKYFSRLLRVMK